MTQPLRLQASGASAGLANPLPVAGDSGGCLVTHRGLKIRLETGVHVDTIECYTLHVVNQDTNLKRNSVMGEGGFPLIPSIYVDNSLLTAVLVGVLVLFALGERFGWPQSGLVVPGYLAGILVVAPEIAGLKKHRGSGDLPTRPAFDSWLVESRCDRPGLRARPLLFDSRSFSPGALVFEAGPGGSLVSAFGLGGGSSLYSVGLVLVPLTANALWMPGLLRGVPLVGLPILAVYALLSQSSSPTRT